MISADGIGTRRWIVNPEEESLGSESCGSIPPGLDVEFAGAGAAANLGLEHLKAAGCAFSVSFTQVVRQNPYRSLLIATGAGILAGILLKRSGA